MQKEKTQFLSRSPLHPPGRVGVLPGGGLRDGGQAGLLAHEGSHPGLGLGGLPPPPLSSSGESAAAACPPPLSGRHVLVQIETDRGRKGTDGRAVRRSRSGTQGWGFKRKDMKKERSVYRGC